MAPSQAAAGGAASAAAASAAVAAAGGEGGGGRGRRRLGLVGMAAVACMSGSLLLILPTPSSAFMLPVVPGGAAVSRPARTRRWMSSSPPSEPSPERSWKQALL